MANLLKPLALAALIALAGPALAQDTATEAPAADTPAADATQAEGAPGTTYVDEQIDDWQHECLRLPADSEGPDPCRMAQILYDAEQNPVGKIAIGRQPEGSPALASGELALPIDLGLLLPEGLTIGVDQGLTKKYDFYLCLPTGCTSRLLFSAEDIAAFKAGKQMILTMVAFLPPDRQATRIQIAVSLKGFTKAFDMLKVPAAAPAASAAPAAAEAPAAAPAE